MEQDLDRRILLSAAGLAGMAALAKLSQAGPLTPPAGAVSSSGRALTEIEPRIPIGATTTPGDATALFVISQPGSYYLTGNVQGVAGKHGISITAVSGVTIDLSGFELRGPGGVANFSGVWSSATQGVRVHSGTVSSWPEYGINLFNSSALIERLTARSNRAAGIGVGPGSTVSGCIASANAIGIDASWPVLVVGSSCSGNTQDGIQAGQGSTISFCNTTGNARGIYCHGPALCHACVSSGNSLSGFVAFSGLVCVDCHSSFNQQSGFEAGGRANLARCHATNNQQSGIVVNDGALVADCTATLNGLHGIDSPGRVVLRNNICDNNNTTAGNGHGINITGTRCRLEANQCSNNRNGINVTSTGNLIIRNSVTGNTQFGYSVAANNLFGPNIFSSSGITGSTNPHANYEM